ncbi:MAG: hypothetical protein Q9159_000183 [Coniocarpon cinnabarinum]
MYKDAVDHILHKVVCLSDEDDSNGSEHRRRYKWIDLPTEDVELYRKKGLHPIQLGTTLDRGRCTVIRKLGYGSFATVWLARDESVGRGDLVAIKVLTSNHKKKIDARHEIKIYEHYDRSGFASRHKHAHVVRLIRHFEEHGVNSSINRAHQCLVFETMGPSCGSILRDPKRFVHNIPGPASNHCPLWLARCMIRDLIDGVGDLHAAGIIHGDIHAGNLLTTIKALSSVDAENLIEDSVRCSSEAARVEQTDGGAVKRAPEYVIASQPLTKLANLDESNAAFKISDVGSAVDSTANKKTKTPACMRAPEIVLRLGLSQKVDIWSIGCLIKILFSVDGHAEVSSSASSYSESDNNVLADDTMTFHVDRLGTLPDSIAAHWPRKSRYYDHQWTKIRSDVEDSDDEDSEGVEKVEEEVFKFPKLEDDFRQHANREIGDAETTEILKVLRACLQYEPHKRPTAEQLKHMKWIKTLQRR